MVIKSWGKQQDEEKQRKRERVQDFRWMPSVCKDTLGQKHIYMFTHKGMQGESKSGYDNTGWAEKTNYSVKNTCIVKQISSSSVNPKIDV